MPQFLSGESLSAQVLASAALILLAGFLLTRITKKLKLPNVTGYIFAGILLGPYVLNAVPREVASGMGFLTDIALAYIAFGVGRYFKLSTLRQSGPKVLIVTLFEALAAAAAITVVMIFVFRLPVPFALLLGAIGCATAPASTIMTIRQYHAKGGFVNLILQIVALDDAVALAAFSVCAAAAQALGGGGHVNPAVVIAPILLNVGAVLLGGLFGVALHKLINEKRSADHRLVLANAFILILCAFCAVFDVSPLLSCMALGAVYINLSNNKELFKQINNFSPPILLMFFVLSGMKLNLPALLTAGLVGVGYFLIRILGKYLGAFAGCAVCRTEKPTRNYLGLALIPQAGVSIGLAALGERLLPPEEGTLLSTIILSSAVLYEIVGPACAKAALFLSHTVKKGDAQPSPPDAVSMIPPPPSEAAGAPSPGSAPVSRKAARRGKSALRHVG